MVHKGIHVNCPTHGCSNKRLFDVDSAARGIVTIKCKNCGAVVVINLDRVTRDKRHLLKYKKELQYIDEDK